jgi:hypothetical protein
MGSCGKEHLNPQQYASWVTNEKHGLVIKKVMNGIEYKVQLKPLDFVALLEEGSNAIDRKKFEQDKKDMEGFEYFTFYISTSDHKKDVLSAYSNDQNDYFSRLNYFANMMQDDIYLQNGDEKVPCAMFHYERDYNLTPFQKFSIAFKLDKQKIKTDQILVFNDRILNNTTIELPISKKAIKDLPDLKIN